MLVLEGGDVRSRPFHFFAMAFNLIMPRAERILILNPLGGNCLCFTIFLKEVSERLFSEIIIVGRRVYARYGGGDDNGDDVCWHKN